jgi:putative FmdB family regulatory protein
MPTYSYRCDDCSHEFDIVQRMSEDALTDCPACKAPKLVKKIQPVGFALKGTGWYVTDFRDKGKKAPTGDGATGAASPEASSESKPEPKTETNAETKAETKAETRVETPAPKAAGATD